MPYVFRVHNQSILWDIYGFMQASIISSKIGTCGYIVALGSHGRNVILPAGSGQNMCCHESSLVFDLVVNFPGAVIRF